MSITKHTKTIQAQLRSSHSMSMSDSKLNTINNNEVPLQKSGNAWDKYAFSIPLQLIYRSFTLNSTYYLALCLLLIDNHDRNTFSPVLQQLLADIIPSTDPLDSLTFNPVEYINNMLPNEQSLTDIGMDPTFTLSLLSYSPHDRYGYCKSAN